MVGESRKGCRSSKFCLLTNCRRCQLWWFRSCIRLLSWLGLLRSKLTCQIDSLKYHACRINQLISNFLELDCIISSNSINSERLKCMSWWVRDLSGLNSSIPVHFHYLAERVCELCPLEKRQVALGWKYTEDAMVNVRNIEIISSTAWPCLEHLALRISWISQITIVSPASEWNFI